MSASRFLIALNPLFWGLFEQAGGSMNLFTDRYVDRGAVPASIFQSINPIYIILFAPFFAALWQWLGKRGMEPSAPAKFGLRSEENTSELQSLMRHSYAVFCLKK